MKNLRKHIYFINKPNVQFEILLLHPMGGPGDARLNLLHGLSSPTVSGHHHCSSQDYYLEERLACEWFTSTELVKTHCITEQMKKKKQHI